MVKIGKNSRLQNNFDWPGFSDKPDSDNPESTVYTLCNGAQFIAFFQTSSSSAATVV